MIAALATVTLVMAAAIAVVQNNLQRALGWLAVSQAGYMMLGIGVGSWAGALFHLLTNAFFMALLFLGAASVMGAMGGEQRLSEYGGLWRKLPVTATLAAVATLALAGTPFFSGYDSLLTILGDCGAYATYATRVAGRSPAYWAFFSIPTLATGLTAFAAARCWMLTFGGRPRNALLYARAHERLSLWTPMLALAIPSVIAGYAMNIPELLGASIVETRSLCNEILATPAVSRPDLFTAMDQIWPIIHPSSIQPEGTDSTDAPAVPPSPAADADDRGNARAHSRLGWTCSLGLVLSIALFWRRSPILERIAAIPPISWVHEWLLNAMYFDELYFWTVGRMVVGLSLACVAFERYVLGGRDRPARSKPPRPAWMRSEGE